MRLRARLGFTVVAVLLVFAVTAFAAAWVSKAASMYIVVFEQDT